MHRHFVNLHDMQRNECHIAKIDGTLQRHTGLKHSAFSPF